MNIVEGVMEDFKGKTTRVSVSSGRSSARMPRQTKKRKPHHLTSEVARISVMSNGFNEKDKKGLTYCEWDNEGLSTNMEFVSNDSKLTIRRQITTRSTDGARCHQGYLQGRHEFLFAFTRKWGSHCAIGLCRKDSILCRPGYVHLLGQDSLSWAFDIPSGQLFYRGHVVGSVGSMMNSDIGRRIGMEIDFDAGCLIIRISIGRVVRTCTYVSEDLCQPPQPLYPAISMVYGLAQCTVQRHSHHTVTNLNQTELVELEDCKKTSLLEREDSVLNGDEEDGQEINPRCNDYADNYDYNDYSVMTPLVVPQIMVTAENLEVEPTWTTDTGEFSEDSLSKSDATDQTIHFNERSSDELVVELGDWNARMEHDCGTGLTAVSELSEKNRLAIESFHGWDNICRGGLVFPHPGAPSICIPAPRLNGGVQAIRGKQGFVSGRHRWKIRQLRFYSKNTTDANDVFVGVVSAEHSVFNYGYSMSSVGSFAWCYRPMIKSFYHGSSVHNLTATADDDSTSSNIDLELELDLDLQTLTYFSRGKALATVRHVRGKQIYPFAIFHKDVNFPIQILYTTGPTDYVDTVLENVAEPEKMVSIFNYQPQLLRSSSIYLTDFGEQSRMDGFHWGQVSPGVKKNPLNVAHLSSSFTKPVILAAECSLSGNIHKVQWTVEAENQANLILGLVAEEFDVGSFSEEMSMGGSARFLGDSTLSWGWDVLNRKLFHAGHPIATYPILAELDCRAFNIYRMTVSYVSMNCSSVSFEIVPKKNSDQTIDLGMAFINIPTNVYPAVMIRPPTKSVSSKTARIMMEYYSGSWNPDGKHPQSRLCSIL